MKWTTCHPISTDKNAVSTSRVRCRNFLSEFKKNIISHPNLPPNPAMLQTEPKPNFPIRTCSPKSAGRCGKLESLRAESTYKLSGR